MQINSLAASCYICMKNYNTHPKCFVPIFHREPCDEVKTETSPDSGESVTSSRYDVNPSFVKSCETGFWTNNFLVLNEPALTDSISMNECCAYGVFTVSKGNIRT